MWERYFDILSELQLLKKQYFEEPKCYIKPKEHTKIYKLQVVHCSTE